MIPPLRKGATLPQPNWPGIETERLLLRQWRAADIADNTAMLGDPESARFITADRKPVTEPMAGWRNAAIMAGHWVLHGFGMFVVEERRSGKFVGRVGPFHPPVWPGFEVGWELAAEFRGKVTRSKRRGRRSSGRLRPSSSMRSSTASIRKMSPRKPWRGGSAPSTKAGPCCSVTPSISGLRIAARGKDRPPGLNGPMMSVRLTPA
jgi:hypothetical protein